MKELPITKEELYIEYMKQVDEICEHCDWVTNFGPKEICDMIYDIIIEKLNS